MAVRQAKRRAGSLTSRLVADIGGTNARFALFERGRLRNDAQLACAEFPDLPSAVRHYLMATGRTPSRWPREAAVAIAAPLLGDRIAMTNHPWSFSASATRRALKLRRLILLNDFTALALAIPHLPVAELAQVGGTAASPGAPIGVIGPGTGLGVSGLLRNGRHWLPLEGEGGHVTLPATSEREFAIVGRLHRHFSHVSAERVLCGSGLVLLHQTLCEVDGLPREPLTAEQITARGIKEAAGACRSTLEQFCAWLGTVAGDLALTLGAFGGIYIGGGIVPRLGEFFAQSEFRSRFEAKGRYGSYLARIPVFVIETRHPALSGCARAFTDPGPRLEAR